MLGDNSWLPSVSSAMIRRFGNALANPKDTGVTIPMPTKYKFIGRCMVWKHSLVVPASAATTISLGSRKFASRSRISFRDALVCDTGRLQSDLFDDLVMNLCCVF